MRPHHMWAIMGVVRQKRGRKPHEERKNAMKKITVDYTPAVSLYQVTLLVEDEQAEDFDPYDPDWREEIENKIEEGDCRYYDMRGAEFDIASVEDAPGESA